MNVDQLARDYDGQLPKYAWPGGYPMYYVSDDGLILCPKCANDTETSDPARWADVHWEGDPLVCDDDGQLIPSAYGDDKE